jgi:hypothetical protein
MLRLPLHVLDKYDAKHRELVHLIICRALSPRYFCIKSHTTSGGGRFIGLEGIAEEGPGQQTATREESINYE